MTDQTNMPEAVASVTYSVTSKGGYNALFTIRGTSGAELLDTMSTIEGVLESKGYKPQVKQTFGGPRKEVEYVEGKVCPKCQGRLVLKKKSDGSPFHQCENKKWNSFTKKNEGICDFTDWLNPPATWDKKEPYKNGGIPVDEYEASMQKTGHDFDEDFSIIH